MEAIDLRGFDILLLEDEPLIMLDTKCVLEAVGARVHCARQLSEAMLLLEGVQMSAAVLDYILADGTADELCEELKRRHIPFSIYSGFEGIDDMCSGGAVISKPVSATELTGVVWSLCLGDGNSSSTCRQ